MPFKFKKSVKNPSNFIPFLPVFFGSGIVLYFSLNTEPGWIFLAILVTLAALWIYLAYKKSDLRIKIPSIIALIITSGFLTAYINAHLSYSPALPESTSYIWVKGKVESLERMKTGSRIVIEKANLRYSKYKPKEEINPAIPVDKELPYKIRLTARTKSEDIKPGDVILVKSILNPPPALPAYPGGYDFSRYAYFNNIGAIGYSISSVRKLYESNEDLKLIASNLRFDVSENILSAFDAKSDEGGIANALLTGFRKRISKDTMENMQKSGLGHLLAISGLHMSLIMASAFFVMRLILAMIPRIVLRYNIKKWSAWAALVAGLFYLVISGAPTSAIRAYIMALMFFIAILIDRTGTPMLPVSWAAMIIMIIQPYSVITPGFQMSFAAVIALVASYERVFIRQQNNYVKRSIPRRIMIYVTGIISSSIIAGMATAPFVLYHFGRHSNYGLLANMMALPIATFWVMPFGMISLLLMPLGLESFSLPAMGWGISLIVDVAAWISSLPGSNIPISKPGGYTLSLFVIGGLFLCLWKNKYRLLGLIPIFIGILLIIFPSPNPDILISGNGKLFALKDKYKNIVFSSLSKERYARREWLSATGQTRIEKLHKSVDKNQIPVYCTTDSCSYQSNGKNILLIGNMPKIISGKSFPYEAESAVYAECTNSDIVIYLSKSNYTCEGKIITISYDSLQKGGTHAIWTGDKVKVMNSAKKRGNRVWTDRF